MIGIYRCIIKGEKSKYYIGKDYNGRGYIIEKNKNIRCKVGDDFYFYAERVKGLLKDKLIPVSDEEAGVIDKKNIINWFFLNL